MKLCGRCGLEKPRSEFNKCRSYKTGIQTWCKLCSREAKRLYSISDVGRVNTKLWKRRKMEKLREIIRQAKSKPCADCGIRYQYWVMDLDHLKDKAFAMGSVKRVEPSEAKLRAEISKCETVCANCHRERTHRRNNIHERPRQVISGAFIPGREDGRTLGASASV